MTFCEMKSSRENVPKNSLESLFTVLALLDVLVTVRIWLLLAVHAGNSSSMKVTTLHFPLLNRMENYEKYFHYFLQQWQK